jgi:lycopene cyclase domain-containing protein
MEKSYYLLLNILTISVPLIRGFEPRIRFMSRWRGLLLGVFIAGTPFIIWDILFASHGVWGFNDRYLTGLTILHLPIEEWLFFITVPIACTFIYEVLILFVKKDLLKPFSRPFSIFLGLTLLVAGLVFHNFLYTGITFLFASLLLLGITFLSKPYYMGRFYAGFFMSLVPFLLVNGILTGSFIENEIVWYNNAENLSVRIFTIPIEDTIYMLALLLINIAVYEWWKQRYGKRTF